MLIVFIICAFSTDSQDFGIHNKTLTCSMDLYIISLLKHHQELILAEGIQVTQVGNTQLWDSLGPHSWG